MEPGPIQTQKLIVLLNAMAIVESGGSPHSYNPETGGTGSFQITPDMVDDLNRFFNANFTIEDFLSVNTSKWAVLAYACIYGWCESPEAIARCWHGGADGPYRYDTMDYWLKVKKLMEAQGTVGFNRNN